MKRKYSKPELYYERYELSSNIAGNCATGLPVVGINSTDYQTCTVNVGGGDLLFLTEVIGCNTLPIEGDRFCYQSFSTNEMLFSS